MPVWPVTCTNCGGSVTEVPPATPCPTCGDTRRTTHVSASDAAFATDGIAGLGIEYAKDRPWQEQWRAVLRGKDEIERSYAGRSDGPADSDRWKQAPIEFCEDCWHLKDHLKKDTAVPEAQVERHANSSPNIRLTGDLANTHKHGGRQPGKTTARIAGVDLRPGQTTKASFRIEWEAPDETTGSNDALVVARAAIAEWRAFFAAHGLGEKG